MTSWYETRIDRMIREAQERGDFDDLPGAGKPLRHTGNGYDPEWWIKQLAERESLGAALPPALHLRRQIEDLPATLAKMSTEEHVRQHVTELNAQIARVRRGPMEGPRVLLRTVDVEEAVRAWKAARPARGSRR